MPSAVKAEAQNVRHLAVIVTVTATAAPAVGIDTTRPSATCLLIYWGPISRYDMCLLLHPIALPSPLGDPLSLSDGRCSWASVLS